MDQTRACVCVCVCETSAILTPREDEKLTGISEIAWLIALQAAAAAPVPTAFIETSTRKKYTAGIGSRTYVKINMHKLAKIDKSRNRSNTIQTNHEFFCSYKFNCPSA